jgi:uncharacterized membrane protein YgcG
MLRFARGTCCAVAFVLGLVLASQVSAEEQADKSGAASKRGNVWEAAEERIQTTLREPLKVPLEHTEVPLIEIIDILQEDFDIPIVFDLTALDELAISPETEITVNLRHISLRSALNHMFKQPGIEELTYVIDDEVLLITTKERADSKLILRVYRVDDFQLHAPQPYPGAVSSADFNPLIDMICSCVEPDSWVENGTGTGELSLIEPAMLVVAQTRRVHMQIDELLFRLRVTRDQINSESRMDESSDALFTQGFKVSMGLGKDSTEDRETLTKTIKQSVVWGNESNEAVWVRFLPQRILVRHRLEVLRQVGPVIEQMGINENPRTSNRAGGSGNGFGGGGGGGFGGGGGGGGGFGGGRVTPDE